ncbi:hypothetical protein SORBI_3002G078900 [Sorghum bicolor]|uniref:Agenet-like domain-containing protein n=1 Tax=Sorghum bicolor TaxID=4558 RepID=A0A1W0W2W7_SORBI|nr:hypothetical protein SORBI_3002G078900 [Sorghum bicolor]
MPFAPHLVRRRRDYVGGEWVPSLSVVEVQPKRGARVYKAGEKVEVLREREAYGESWFPATVAKAVDRLSYIVEYCLDEQEGGGKATEYLHFLYIRPAEYHRLRESKVQLGPGTAVEVHCDGAWSPGVVRRVVREGCEYEVSVNGEVVEQLLTKAADQLRPLCIWNAKHWTIPTVDKGQHNLRQQYASRKRTISRADAGSSDDEGLQRASVSGTDASLSASCKSLASNHCLNSCSLLSEKNGLSVFPHRTLNTCSVSKNGLLCSSSGHSAPPDELMPNAIGETEFSQDVEMVLSDDQHKTLVCGRNADETRDMLSAPEVRKQNIASSLINQQIQERPLFVKTLSVKKGITKNRGGTHSKSHQGKNDAPENVQIQLKGNRNFSSKQFLFALSAFRECQTTSAQTLQVTGGTSSGSDAEGVNFNQLARSEGTGLLDKELAATINRICEGDRNPDVCTDTADTQVTKSNYLTDKPLQSHDRLVPQDGNQVDEGSILQSLQNDGSSVFTSDILLSSFPPSGNSMPSDLAFSQISGHQVPFVKRSPAWCQVDAMDVFKEKKNS